MNNIDEILRSREGHLVLCPECGAEAVPVERIFVKSSGEVELPCGCATRVGDVERFNREPGQRSLEYGCFLETLIPQGERIRVFDYISSKVEIKGMLLSLGYRMVSEEIPDDRELEEEYGSYPVCSGEQIWVKEMSIAYVNRQYCEASSFRGNIHIAIVGTISDWEEFASLMDKHRERSDKQVEISEVASDIGTMFA